MSFRYTFPVLATIFLGLSACNKNTAEEQKSLSYYSQHLSEAETVIAKCDTRENNELSLMSPEQRFTWEGTAQGINCRNARDARADNRYSEYQKRMREEANKYK